MLLRVRVGVYGDATASLRRRVCLRSLQPPEERLQVVITVGGAIIYDDWYDCHGRVSLC